MYETTKTQIPLYVCSEYGPDWLCASNTRTRGKFSTKLDFLCIHGVYKGDCILNFIPSYWGLPRWLSGNEFACNAGDSGDTDSIPVLGRSPGEGNGNPLQYSCLEISMDRGAWQATVHGVAKSQTRLSMHHHTEKPECTFGWPSTLLWYGN